jgi:hypothetical protein
MLQYTVTLFHTMQFRMFYKLMNMAEINSFWFLFVELQVMYES